MNKTISFITPVFNDATSIEKQVHSLNDQDLPNIEIILVNDGSTDDSKKVLDNLLTLGLVNKVIHLEKNEGACNARNKGAKEASGKYLSFLPADAILYPGMARIWYDTLEENPDYDFMYGGYHFTDEEGEIVQTYSGELFDPYLLEVSNYIDGSFPIKKESFWNYAEKRGQPDGLWDPAVKSLQDWDYWLSVVKNGGKGIYVQDIFFSTELPHPGGLSYDSSAHWLERIEMIKKKHNIPIRKLCVTSLGASWHGKRMAYLLNADFKEMPSFKPHRYDAIYVIGFYPEFAKEQDQMFLNNCFKSDEGRTAAKKVIHFVGSDIWQLYHVSMASLKFYQHYFKNMDEILCEAEFTQKELKELGIDAKIVPLPPATLYKIRPLPKDFTVACYQPLINAKFYNSEEMIEIAKKLPDVKFKFFGNPKKLGSDPALPQNIEFCGYITDMNSFISECSAIMRFPQHDGLPISVLEFILAGRYSVQSVPIEYSYHLPELNTDKIVIVINELRQRAEKGTNQEGSDYWHKELSHDVYCSRIRQLTGYEPKAYWENRAEQWTRQAERSTVEYEDIKPFFDEIKPKSVLDIGCGDGRWYPKLKEWGIEEYRGIDISENLIKAAQFRFPHLKDFFSQRKVEDLNMAEEIRSFDLIFSYTCLEHVKEEDFQKAVEAIKKKSKKLLLIEPENFISRYYCFNHDYRKHFKVIKEMKLKDKTILLCDLES